MSYKPITGGNEFILNQYLRQLNNNQGFNTYGLILFNQMNYYTNLFKFDTDNKQLKDLENILLTNLGGYGKLAILKIGDELFCCTYTAEQFNKEGIPTKGRAQIVNYLFNTGLNTEQEATTKYINLNEKDFVFFRWNAIGLPGGMYWYKYAKEQEAILKAIFSEVFGIGKKMVVNIHSQLTPEQEQQIRDMLALGSPVVFRNVDIDANNPNKNLNDFSELEKPSTSENSGDYIQEHKKYGYDNNGRRHNEYEKSERSISGELGLTISVSEIMESGIKRELEKGCRQLLDKFNIPCEVQATFDLRTEMIPNGNNIPNT